MNIRNILLIPILFILSLSCLVSCGVDRWQEYAKQTELDIWIDSLMHEDYLWYADIPFNAKQNYFAAPGIFLKTLLSSKDRNFSHVDTLGEVITPSYGYNYSLHRVVGNDTAYCALVTYVLPNSPAATAKLERGECIMKVNGNVLTTKHEKLLKSGDALDLVIGKYEKKKDTTGKEIDVAVATRTTKLGAMQIVENNPVHYYNMYTTSNGAKVGYLVYSHFTPGNRVNAQKYNDQLRAISKKFLDYGISEIILDLRYNAGGEMECAQLLCTMIAPEVNLDNPLAYLVYNDKKRDKDRTLTFDSKLLQPGGVNLNLSKITFISGSTTAGASEMMINCLNSPIMGTLLIGSKTVGENVATEPFIHPQYPWSVNPVVCTIYNSQHESGYTGGFVPKYAVQEAKNLTQFLPFGDPKEELLSVALGVIEGTYPPVEKPKEKSSY